MDTTSFISWLPDDYNITALQESVPYYVKNGQKSQCFTIYNEYTQRQTKYSFFHFCNEANNKIDRPMLENSRASNSRAFIGVLSKFPKLKRSVVRIAGQRFIHCIRVIRSLRNLCLNCNHCIRIFHACFELPSTWQQKNFEQFVYKLVSWNLLTSVLTSYCKKNYSFAEWNDSSDASEAKDCSES